jgi:hypothetical protein
MTELQEAYQEGCWIKYFVAYCIYLFIVMGGIMFRGEDSEEGLDISGKSRNIGKVVTRILHESEAFICKIQVLLRPGDAQFFHSGFKGGRF